MNRCMRMCRRNVICVSIFWGLVLCGFPKAAAFEEDPYIGSIEMWAGTYAPWGWAFCHGQILQIAQNQALFALIGTTFGGDGRTTFALPDLRGRIPVGCDSTIGLGQTGGAETVALTSQDIALSVATAKLPAEAFSASGTTRAIVTDTGGLEVPTEPRVLGGTQRHSNMQPYLTVNYIIALTGFFPTRP